MPLFPPGILTFFRTRLRRSHSPLLGTFHFNTDRLTFFSPLSFVGPGSIIVTVFSTISSLFFSPKSKVMELPRPQSKPSHFQATLSTPFSLLSPNVPCVSAPFYGWVHTSVKSSATPRSRGDAFSICLIDPPNPRIFSEFPPPSPVL